MPCSSPRNSGWRATDWIIEPKMFPMPTPAPRAPSPTPSARPIALPAFVTSPDVAAMRVASMFLCSSLVLGLDGRADVDGRKGREDKGLDRDDDDHLEEVEDRRDRDDRDQQQALEDEDEPDEREDQDVPCEHVREETDAQRDEAHELAQDLERHDEDEQRLRRLGNPALEVARRAVPANALDVCEDKCQKRERERHGQ